MYDQDLLVQVGQKVSAGTHIANVGANGVGSGPHLHFEIRTDATTPVDPLDYIDPDNPRPKPSSLTSITGDSVKQEVCLTLKASGFSDNGIAAIMTNIQAESDFNPNALGDINIGGSFGLCQWYSGTSRLNALKTMYPDWLSLTGEGYISDIYKKYGLDADSIRKTEKSE